MISTTGDDDNVTSVVEAVRAALFENGDEGQDNSPVVAILSNPTKIAKPSFLFIHTLAYFFAQRTQCCKVWMQTLFALDHQEGLCFCESREERLLFLVRLLAILSCLCENHLYIFVSPSQVLCGKDISGAHFLLKCLCSSTTFPAKKHKEAVEYLQSEGDRELYKRGVLTRQAVVRFQAIVRGRLARTVLARNALMSYEPISTLTGDASVFKETCSGTGLDCEENKALKNEVEELKRTRDTLVDLNCRAQKELEVTETRLEQQNKRLAKLLMLGAKHKTAPPPLSTSSLFCITKPPRSAPSSVGSGRPYKINPVADLPLDIALVEKVQNFRQRQNELKRREQEMGKKEARLRQRLARTKCKEKELEMQEQRVVSLSDRVRKHQSQLKQVEIERATENFVNLPPNSNKPCVKCLEQKQQLRNARAKLQQKKNALAKREAAVLARARSIRRLQILLREKIEATKANEMSVAETSPSSGAASVFSNASSEEQAQMVCRKDESEIQENEDGGTKQQQCEDHKAKTPNDENFHQQQQQNCVGNSIKLLAGSGSGGGHDCKNGEDGYTEIAHLQIFATAESGHKRSNQVPATIMEEEEHNIEDRRRVYCP